MVPEFEAAVTAMQAGQVSEPVKSQFGWHLIKLNEKRETAPPTLDEARPEIENQLRQAALRRGSTSCAPPRRSSGRRPTPRPRRSARATS